MRSGNGIVSGGALNVDYIALDEALQYDPTAERIRIFIPTTLEVYCRHYRKHAKLKTITENQAEDLITQLSSLKQINPEALIENNDTNFTEDNKKQMYYERNSRVVEASDELVAFHIITKESEGAGTTDTIHKAEEKGIPVKMYSYRIKA
jgi:hypothetical protein